MSELVRVAAADVPEGKPVHLDGGSHGVCLVKVAGRYYALADRCSHAEVRLSEGDVDPEECTVECWKHGSAFSLLDGIPQSLPAIAPVAVYAVRVDGDQVIVEEAP